MASLVNKLRVVVCLLMVMTGWMTVSGELTDEVAGASIDRLSPYGIKLLNGWRKRMIVDKVSEIEEILDRVENSLVNDFGPDSMPNATAYAITQMSDAVTKLDQAQIKVDNLGLTNTEDGLLAFLRTQASGTVDLPLGNYNADATASGTFTAPQEGLYQITVRSTAASGVNLQIMKNGAETLSTLVHSGQWDIKTRISLVWLVVGDQIYLTGGTASYFGVMLLRVQTLMPRYV